MSTGGEHSLSLLIDVLLSGTYKDKDISIPDNNDHGDSSKDTLR